MRGGGGLRAQQAHLFSVLVCAILHVALVEHAHCCRAPLAHFDARVVAHTLLCRRHARVHKTCHGIDVEGCKHSSAQLRAVHQLKRELGFECFNAA
eukprot:4596179-Pleurochrysis_carterae.AAC.1